MKKINLLLLGLTLSLVALGMTILSPNAKALRAGSAGLGCSLLSNCTGAASCDGRGSVHGCVIVCEGGGGVVCDAAGGGVILAE